MKFEFTENRVRRIMPYFGYLDQVFTFLTRFSRQSNEIMRKSKDTSNEEIVKKRRTTKHIKMQRECFKKYEEFAL